MSNTGGVPDAGQRTAGPWPISYRPHRPTGGRGRRAVSVAMKVAVGLAIVALLVGPWLYLVVRRASGFLGASVSHDVLARVAKPLEGHAGPPGYHLALTFATFLPWSPLLPMAVVFAWKHRADPRLRFALAAVAGPWALFEAVQTKLPHYMLPAFPPLAFLTADAIVRCLRGEAHDLRRRAFLVAATVMALVVVAMGVGAAVCALRFGDPVAPPLVLVLTTVALAAAVFAAFVRRKLAAGLLAMGLGMAAVYAVAFVLYLPSADALRVSPRAAAILRRAGATGPGDAIMLDYKEPGLAFYQGGTIREDSTMVLSHELLDRAPRWLAITDDVWAKTPEDVRRRVETVGSAHGVAYADGRVVTVRVVRRR